MHIVDENQGENMVILMITSNYRASSGQASEKGLKILHLNVTTSRKWVLLVNPILQIQILRPRVQRWEGKELELKVQ